ncbi:AAA family ATPase [Paraburkholderia sp. MMS20-SJTR3]|uniref:AAA family ATPase n=1 Tax=Paraburkholderia sejongensis TaxID=2886946 RepID=A0ABS8JS26_9BURK|nr:AAA family ATPase [Paraburkholderia sp. MMS20-SJTR3]MCC8392691.1 AAA family ATPase [Paraburkholderia sp. MMS20-SJTR3]
MINILALSEDGKRLAQIAHLTGECGDYRITRASGRPSLLGERGDSLDAFDVLIVDAVSLQDAQPAVVEALHRAHGRLTCILLVPDASPDTLIAAMRAGFRDVLNWPLDPRQFGDALQRAQAQSLQGGRRDTRILSFISSKGGAGTSFIAANVAHAIASLAQKKRVLLIDLNQQFADAAFLVSDQTPPSTLPQICAQIERMDAAFFDTSLVHVTDSFHILAGAGDPVKAAEIKEERLEWLLGVAAPHYDFVLFDLGQTLNRLSMLALDRSDHIHIVLQASMAHVRAGRRLQEILCSVGFAQEQMRLILNRYSRHGERPRAALESVLGMSAYQVIPEDADTVADAMNQGLPVSKTARGSGVARSLQALAENVVAGTATPGRGRAKGESLFGRLLGRQNAPKLETL